MITGKTPHHERWARAAMRCFLEQTYPASHRELLVVNDGDYRLAVEGEVPTDDAGRPLVREVVLPQGEKKLGELRNVGIEEAWGDYIIQWDDDDWHGPTRIEYQAAPLEADSDKVCTFLNRQLRYSFEYNSAKFFTSNRIHGTVMFRKTDIRYPAKGMAEDTDLMFKYTSEFGSDSIVTLDVPHEECDKLYIRFHHGQNTWPSGHIMGLSAIIRGVWRIPDETTARLQRVLKDFYSFEAKPGRDKDGERAARFT